MRNKGIIEPIGRNGRNGQTELSFVKNLADLL
jgi:hypothetical protein